MSKRIVICCDGTWNSPDEFDQYGAPIATNVTNLAFVVKDRDASGMRQLMFYERGVGTGRFDHITGGAFGLGLSARIQEAYVFLVENFEPGDELFIFGFSRGAYTARSLAGFIRNSGILQPRYADRLDVAYDLYRDRTSQTHPRARESQLFRRTYSIGTPIRFIGVWDTVGSLGIPDTPLLPTAISDYWKFHDVSLSTTIDRAYHALAIDEHRKPFLPTLWEQQPDAPASQVLQQVWFTGVHSDVGGGYRDTGLSDIALVWLMAMAENTGLALERDNLPGSVQPDACGKLHDSMTRLYALQGKVVRDIGAVHRDAKGNVLKTNEFVAAPAKRRWDSDSSYRPPNLDAYIASGREFVPVPGVTESPSS